VARPRLGLFVLGRLVVVVVVWALAGTAALGVGTAQHHNRSTANSGDRVSLMP
jgi:hypothetical protein